MNEAKGSIEMPKDLAAHLEGKESDSLRDKTKFLSVAVRLGYITEETRKKVLEFQEKQAERDKLKVGEILKKGTKGRFNEQFIQKVLEEQKRIRDRMRPENNERKNLRVRRAEICQKDVEISCKNLDTNKTFKASLENISVGGLGFKTQEKIQKESKINLRFTIEEKMQNNKANYKTFNLVGKIISNDNNYYGVKFINLKQEYKNFLQEMTVRLKLK